MSVDMYGEILEGYIEAIEQEIYRLEKEGQFDNRFEIEKLGHYLDDALAELAELDEEHGIGP